MTAVWVVAIVGLLLLGLGVLVGSYWTVQAINRQHRRLDIEQQELDEWARTLYEDSQTRCVQCDNMLTWPTDDYEDDEDAGQPGDPPPVDGELYVSLAGERDVILTIFPRLGFARSTSHPQSSPVLR